MTHAALEPAEHGNTAEELLGRIGQLTRQLREGLRELGLDKQVAKAAQAIPDARDRLGYIASMTERAAHRALRQPEGHFLPARGQGLCQRPPGDPLLRGVEAGRGQMLRARRLG